MCPCDQGCAYAIEGCQRISGGVSRKLLTNIRSHTIGFLHYLMAVLTAIAIPVFTSQMEKARESTDLSNCRSYYSEIVTAILTGDLDTSSQKINVQGLEVSTSGAKGVAVGSTFTVTVADAPIKQTVNNWQTAGPQCAGVAIPTDLTVAAKMPITYTFKVQTDGDVMLDSVSYGSSGGSGASGSVTP